MNKLLRIALLLLAMQLASAQKSVYLPLYLQDPNTGESSQYSADKTAQSDNFILIWGNTVGTDPSSYTEDPTLAFNPTTILATMESIYADFKELGFIEDGPGTNLSLYKIPVIMLNTWGPGIGEGYAFGGQSDGVIGTFWVHPIAMQTGDVAAHELTHSIQAQIVIDYRTANGLGGVWDNAGIFWETHANFMRNLIYPQDVTAWGMDVYHVETLGDWKNTYENYPFLFAIKESEGMDMVNNLWKLSLSNEYPLQAYKRLANYSQAQFNDKMYEYVRRMPTYDFETVGQWFRQYRANDMINWLPTVQAAYTILKQLPGSDTRFEVPIELAPEEYAYNIIPIYPDTESCTVIVKFKGQTGINTHAGWRYGFVAQKPDGTISRYSQTYKENTAEASFALEGDETAMYMVIMGAPFNGIQTNPSNDTWKGYPKHFRYPYELNITGGKPEGFQPSQDFRKQIKIDGHIHANGGGWVQNSAEVEASVYIGPKAIVLGNADLTGNVRIENTAIVSNATMSGDVKVIDNAVVVGGTYSGSAIISGQSFVENVTMSEQAKIDMRARVTNYDLSGDIEVGGDVVVYNENGACNNGVYYVMTNYYEDNLLQCDNRTAAHPDNLDVNASYTNFTDANMQMVCTCANLPECLTLNNDQFVVNDKIKIYPNPTDVTVNFTVLNGISVTQVVLYDILGKIIFSQDQVNIESINISSLNSGVYTLRLTLSDNSLVYSKIMKK